MTGELDVATAPQLALALSEQQRERGASVVVDLSGVTFMDVRGARVLFDAARRAETGGGRLEILNPQPPVRRLFALTALDRMIIIGFSSGSR